MNENRLKVLFVLDKANINIKGFAPLRCRITYLGKRKVFSVGMFVIPKMWNSKQQLYNGGNSKEINMKIRHVKQKINKSFLELQIKEINFTLEDLFSHYRGNNIKIELGTIEYFEEYLINLKKVVDIDIKKVTWNKYYYILKDVKSFISYKYKVEDYSLKKLDMDFIIDFELFLKIEKKKKQITVNKNLQRFKKVIKTALIKKHIQHFPFIEHKSKRVVTKIVFLSNDELLKLENQKFSQFRLQQVRDLFIFCCYTGLAYQEMNDLKRKHIVKGFDGNLWIKMIRKKTNNEIAIPLLSKAIEIINKYQEKNKDVLPKISNQKFNSYLKEIAEIVGIEKRLTHHIARKTFATTILLYNDVPMEVVSELLGHSNMIITQEHYAKVVHKKVSEQMKALSQKLNEK